MNVALRKAKSAIYALKIENFGPTVLSSAFFSVLYTPHLECLSMILA